MRRKILIVDDSETIRSLERQALGDHYDVAAAADGYEALDMAARDRPDVILMDLIMPGMDGVEASRLLKAHADTRDIPILIVTTVTAADHLGEAMLAGCVDYLLKPIVAAELLARVRAVLGESDPWQMGTPDH